MSAVWEVQEAKPADGESVRVDVAAPGREEGAGHDGAPAGASPQDPVGTKSEAEPSRSASPSIFDLWDGVHRGYDAERLELPPASGPAAARKPAATSAFDAWHALYGGAPRSASDGEAPADAADAATASAWFVRFDTGRDAGKAGRVEADDAVTTAFSAWYDLYSGKPSEKKAAARPVGPLPDARSEAAGDGVFRRWRELMPNRSLLQRATAGDGESAYRPAQAYLGQLARRGADPQTLLARQRLLGQLLKHLGGIRYDGYRAAVDSFLADCRDDERAVPLQCAREYFYFWIGDVRRLGSRAARKAFAARDVAVDASAGFAALCERMARERFGRFPPSLAIYLGHLYEQGLPGAELARRERLLQALVYLQGDAPYLPARYRTALDALLSHFAEPADQSALVSLAREYFYYWVSVPPASARAA